MKLRNRLHDVGELCKRGLAIGKAFLYVGKLDYFVTFVNLTNN